MEKTQNTQTNDLSKKTQLKGEQVNIKSKLPFLEGYVAQVKSYFQASQACKTKTNTNNHILPSLATTQKYAKLEPCNRSRPTVLFKDPKSPWINCLEEIKKLFDKEDIENNIFRFPSSIENLFTDIMQNKESSFSWCMSQDIQTYFICLTCQQYKPEQWERLVICQRCFHPEDHKMHYYRKQKIQEKHLVGRVHCICGKDLIDRIGKRVSCKEHIQRQIQQESNQNSEKVLRKVKNLFEISFFIHSEVYSQERVLEEQISQYLDFLNLILQSLRKIVIKDKTLIGALSKYLFNNKCPIYSEKSKQNKNLEINIKNEKLLKYLIITLQHSTELQEMISTFLGDPQFMKQFVSQYFGQYKLDDRWLKDRTKKQIFLHRSTFEVMRDKNIKIPWYLNKKLQNLWFKDPEWFDHGVQFFRNSLSNQYSRYDWVNQTDETLRILGSANVCMFFKEKGSEIITLLLNACRNIFDQSYSDEDRYENQSILRERKQKQYEIKKRTVQVYHRVILSNCQNSINKISFVLRSLNVTWDEDEQMTSEQIFKQNLKGLDFVLQSILQNSSFLDGSSYLSILNRFFQDSRYEQNETKKYDKSFQLYVDRLQNQICSLLYINALMKLKLKSYHNYFDSFFAKLCNSLRASQNFHYKRSNNEYIFKGGDRKLEVLRHESKGIYKILQLILFMKFLTPLFDNQLTSKTECQTDEKLKKQIVIRSWFYMKKIPPQLLRLQRRNLRIGEFKQLVSKYLEYNLETKFYFYREEQKFEDNVVRLLSEDGFVLNFCDMQRIKYYVREQGQIELMRLSLIKSGFMKKQRRRIKKLILDFKNNEKAQAALFNQYIYYISYQLIVEAILHQKQEQKEAISQLDRMRSSQQYRFPFRMSNQQKYQVQEVLFGKQAKDKRKALIEQLEPLNEKVQLLRQKKGVINKQYSQKRINILGSQIQLQDQTHQQCIICKQIQTSQNGFVYFASLNINQTIPSTFFKETNKAKTYFKICFHPIHLGCYSRQAICPLCKKYSNCIIPAKYRASNQKLNRICTNSMVVTLFQRFSVYDLQNLFILLFKHLIQSKVFVSMINVELYQYSKKKRQHTEEFIEKFLIEMYQNADLKEKDQYSMSVERLVKESDMVKDTILGKIQHFYISSLFLKIKSPQQKINIQKITDLATKMRSQDYMVIKFEAEATFKIQEKRNEDVDTENVEEKVKIGKNYPIRLPEDIRQINNFDFPCQNCKNKLVYKMCLICGVSFCKQQQCMKVHEKQHEKKVLDFFFDEAKVKFNFLSSSQSPYLNPKQKEVPLYYSQLMIPYRECLSITPLDANDSIILNKKFYYGLAEMLLDE